MLDLKSFSTGALPTAFTDEAKDLAMGARREIEAVALAGEA